MDQPRGRGFASVREALLHPWDAEVHAICHTQWQTPSKGARNGLLTISLHDEPRAPIGSAPRSYAYNVYCSSYRDFEDVHQALIKALDAHKLPYERVLVGVSPEGRYQAVVPMQHIRAIKIASGSVHIKNCTACHNIGWSNPLDPDVRYIMLSMLQRWFDWREDQAAAELNARGSKRRIDE